MAILTGVKVVFFQPEKVEDITPKNGFISKLPFPKRKSPKQKFIDEHAEDIKPIE